MWSVLRNSLDRMPFDRSHTEDLLRFISAAPSPYLAAAEVAERLVAAGFDEVGSDTPWQRDGEGQVRQVLVRDGAVAAWHIPTRARGDWPLRIVGAHTDSPALKIKPRPDWGSEGWRQVACEVYGGALLNSWLDRDLGLAGRIVTAEGATHTIHVDRPLLRVPQLAIHLDRGVTDNGLVLNKQQHLTPVWGLGPVREGALAEFVSAEAGVCASEVVAWDLVLFDVQAPTMLGLDDEFVSASRLDNLCSTHIGCSALAAVAGDSQSGQARKERGAETIRVFIANDHEEVGSASATGAAGPLLEEVVNRIHTLVDATPQERFRSLSASVCLSMDMAHAVHPNYPERHEPCHRPHLNQGPVLKINANQRYATEGRGIAAWEAACRAVGVKSQVFVSRNDMPCGSTIGPLTATRLGITTVDVGCPQLSMHSAREMCGADDPPAMARVAVAFYMG